MQESSAAVTQRISSRRQGSLWAMVSERTEGPQSGWISVGLGRSGCSDVRSTSLSGVVLISKALPAFTILQEEVSMSSSSLMQGLLIAENAG